MSLSYRCEDCGNSERIDGPPIKLRTCVECGGPCYPDHEADISYRCQACNEEYDERNDAVLCFESHTRHLGEMIVRIYDSSMD